MIVITGGAGFIGSVLAWEFNKRGHDNLIISDWCSTTDKWKNISKRSLRDIIAPEQTLDFLEQNKTEIQCVYHMGACSSTTEKDMDYLLENNFHYSQDLFNWCLRNEKRFMYASSAATYGNGEKGFDDKTPSTELRPLNPYGYSKVLFDRWVDLQKDKPIQCVGLKFFNVYGPNEYHKESMASMVFKAYNQINEKGEISLFKSLNPDFKDGEQLRDFVYVKDVTQWMYELFENKDVNGLFNMGFGKARTWLDLARAVFSSCNKEEKINWIDMGDDLRNQYQYFTEAKMEKWTSANLSQPKWSLEDGIKDYVSNYLSTDDIYA